MRQGPPRPESSTAGVQAKLSARPKSQSGQQPNGRRSTLSSTVAPPQTLGSLSVGSLAGSRSTRSSARASSALASCRMVRSVASSHGVRSRGVSNDIAPTSRTTVESVPTSAHVSAAPVDLSQSLPIDVTDCNSEVSSLPTCAYDLWDAITPSRAKLIPEALIAPGIRMGGQGTIFKRLARRKMRGGGTMSPRYTALSKNRGPRGGAVPGEATEIARLRKASPGSASSSSPSDTELGSGGGGGGVPKVQNRSETDPSYRPHSGTAVHVSTMFEDLSRCSTRQSNNPADLSGTKQVGDPSDNNDDFQTFVTSLPSVHSTEVALVTPQARPPSSLTVVADPAFNEDHRRSDANDDALSLEWSPQGHAAGADRRAAGFRASLISELTEDDGIGDSEVEDDGTQAEFDEHDPDDVIFRSMVDPSSLAPTTVVVNSRAGKVLAIDAPRAPIPYLQCDPTTRRIMKAHYMQEQIATIEAQNRVQETRRLEALREKFRRGDAAKINSETKARMQHRANFDHFSRRRGSDGEVDPSMRYELFGKQFVLPRPMGKAAKARHIDEHTEKMVIVNDAGARDEMLDLARRKWDKKKRLLTGLQCRTQRLKETVALWHPANRRPELYQRRLDTSTHRQHVLERASSLEMSDHERKKRLADRDAVAQETHEMRAYFETLPSRWVSRVWMVMFVRNIKLHESSLAMRRAFAPDSVVARCGAKWMEVVHRTRRRRRVAAQRKLGMLYCVIRVYLKAVYGPRKKHRAADIVRHFLATPGIVYEHRIKMVVKLVRQAQTVLRLVTKRKRMAILCMLGQLNRFEETWLKLAERRGINVTNPHITAVVQQYAGPPPTPLVRRGSAANIRLKALRQAAAEQQKESDGAERQTASKGIHQELESGVSNEQLTTLRGLYRSVFTPLPFSIKLQAAGMWMNAKRAEYIKQKEKWRILMERYKLIKEITSEEPPPVPPVPRRYGDRKAVADVYMAALEEQKKQLADIQREAARRTTTPDELQQYVRQQCGVVYKQERENEISFFHKFPREFSVIASLPIPQPSTTMVTQGYLGRRRSSLGMRRASRF